jgi:predicted lysophospholipase L1 biosynthesis ABC-type transport system permease subunit
MNSTKEHLDTLHEIRNLMERSSRFISLSGLSGVFAGIYALAGAATAFYYLKLNIFEPSHYEYLYSNGRVNSDFVLFFLVDAMAVLLAALVTGILLTTRKARKQGLSIWNNTSRRLLISMTIPLVTGGLFCLALLYHHMFIMIAPATLIFYGLALINGSKYTLRDVHYLGLSEIVLGIAGSFLLGYGLLIWTIGFGIMHIIYGTVMYYKYERES